MSRKKWLTYLFMSKQKNGKNIYFDTKLKG